MTAESNKTAIEFIRQAQGAPEVAQYNGKWYVLERYGRVRNSDMWWHEETRQTTIGDSWISRLAYRPAMMPTYPLKSNWELTGEATDSCHIANIWIDSVDEDAIKRDGLYWRLRRKPAAAKPAEPVEEVRYWRQGTSSLRWCKTAYKTVIECFDNYGNGDNAIFGATHHPECWTEITAAEYEAAKAAAEKPAVAAPVADAVRDFEERITPHILRNWDRERIVAFATHLLGDTCQGCQKVAPAVTAGVVIESTSLLAGDSQFRCTVCGRIGTVGRCCGRDTREPMNDIARAEIEAERKAERRASA